MKVRDSYMEKHRLSAADRAAQVGRKSENRGQQGPMNIVEGLFDQLMLNTKRSLWVRWSNVTYTYEIYDSETQQVVEVEADWLEAIQHFIAANNARIWCSSGAHRNQPCYGCSHRTLHYDWVREQEKGGIKLPDNKRRAPVSAANRIIMPVTVCEKHVKMPALNADGEPRVSQAGNPIFNWVPMPVAKLTEDRLTSEVLATAKTGHKVWWNIPQTVLSSYVELKEKAFHYCSNCPAGSDATPLVYKRYKCEECGERYSYDEPLIGISTEDPELITAPFKCKACNHKGPKVPLASCPTCKKGRHGNHLAFDYRLKRKELGENMWTFEVTGVRVRSDVPEYAELAANPLDVKKICGPTPIARQEKIFPERMRAQAGSRRHIKDVKDKTESYTDDTSDNMYE